jgi:hypothetical protein
VELAVGRLETANGRESVKMAVYSGMDDAFEDFRKEIEVGNRTVTG